MPGYNHYDARRDARRRLQSLEVTAESEADTSRFFGISDASLAMIGLRMSITIGAKGVGEGELRDLVAWSEARSTVACTVREHPEIAVDVTVVSTCSDHGPGRFEPSNSAAPCWPRRVLADRYPENVNDDNQRRRLQCVSQIRKIE